MFELQPSRIDTTERTLHSAVQEPHSILSSFDRSATLPPNAARGQPMESRALSLTILRINVDADRSASRRGSPEASAGPVRGRSTECAGVRVDVAMGVAKGVTRDLALPPPTPQSRAAAQECPTLWSSCVVEEAFDFILGEAFPEGLPARPTLGLGLHTIVPEGTRPSTTWLASELPRASSSIIAQWELDVDGMLEEAAKTTAASTAVASMTVPLQHTTTIVRVDYAWEVSASLAVDGDGQHIPHIPRPDAFAMSVSDRMQPTAEASLSGAPSAASAGDPHSSPFGEMKPDSTRRLSEDGGEFVSLPVSPTEAAKARPRIPSRPNGANAASPDPEAPALPSSRTMQSRRSDVCVSQPAAPRKSSQGVREDVGSRAGRSAVGGQRTRGPLVATMQPLPAERGRSSTQRLAVSTRAASNSATRLRNQRSASRPAVAPVVAGHPATVLTLDAHTPLPPNPPLEIGSTLSWWSDVPLHLLHGPGVHDPGYEAVHRSSLDEEHRAKEMFDFTLRVRLSRSVSRGRSSTREFKAPEVWLPPGPTGQTSHRRFAEMQRACSVSQSRPTTPRNQSSRCASRGATNCPGNTPKRKRPLSASGPGRRQPTGVDSGVPPTVEQWRDDVNTHVPWYGASLSNVSNHLATLFQAAARAQRQRDATSSSPPRSPRSTPSPRRI